MTVSGDGFSASLTRVILDLTQYSLASANAQITYSSIVFITQQDQSGTFPIRASVNGVSALCNANCNFTFSSSATPTLSSITPTTLTAPNTDFTISGNLFGTDMTKVHVTVGQIVCEIQSVTDTTIACRLPYLSFGSQTVNFLIDGNT